MNLIFYIKYYFYKYFLGATYLDEKLPKFPGGEIKFQKFLNQNLVYPKKALDNSIEGEVNVKFLINKSGKISEIKNISNAPEILFQEVERVLSKSPKWKPGRQNFKIVEVYFNIKITFNLNETNASLIQTIE